MFKNKIGFSLFVLGMLAGVSQAFAGTATIDPTTTFQSIRGFGGSSAWHESAFSSQLATWFWDSTGMTGNNPNGIGMSMLRCHIPYTNTVGATGGTGISDPGETAVMKQAISLGVTQVWVTEWAPPNTYNNSGGNWGASNNTFKGPASGAANSADTGYAAYLVNYVQYVNAQLASTGVKVLAVSPQNEPDWNPTYEGCLWNGGQFDVFVPALHAALQTAGLTTNIIVPESFADAKSEASNTMDDATAAPEVAFIGNHLYGLNGATPYSLANSGFTHVTNQESWETEMSDVSGASNDTGMTSGIQVAKWVQQCIVDASMNAYHAWWIQNTSDGDNEALIGQNAASTKKLWALGNWSRFVRPGFYRMGATESPASGLLVSAYKNNSSTAPATEVIVAINSNSSTTSQTFTFSGSTVTSVTPWVTDANNNLTRQTAIAVSGNSFTYSLTGPSVTTFVAAASGGTPVNTATSTPVVPTATPTIVPSATATLTPIVASTWRVNAGGPAYTDTLGNVWSADKNFNGGTTIGEGAAITGTSDSALYDTQRYGTFSYSFNVPAGSYQVTLKLAETYSGDDSAGARVFNVGVNGATVLTNLDIFSQVGANTADDKVLSNVSPVNGTITIQFTGGTSTDMSALVEAIQIVPMSTAATATATSVPLTSTSTASPSATKTATVTSTVTATLTGTSSPTMTPVPPTSTPTVPVALTSTATPVVASTWRVNAGGPAYTDVLGNVWAGDENFMGGNTITEGGTIAGTNDSTLYDTQRYGTFSYAFNVPAGSYQVTLKLAETYSGDDSVGARVFNVGVNGATVLTNLDIFSQVGANTADDKVLSNVSPVNGIITIQFMGGTSADVSALVEGIQIVPMSSVATATATSIPATATLTATASLTGTATLTKTVTDTFTATSTASATSSPTGASSPTQTPVPPTATWTSSPAPPTFTFTATETPTVTNSPIPPTQTNTPVPPTLSPTGTATKTMTVTPSATFTATLSPTGTVTATKTVTPVPPTPSPTATWTLTPMPTATNTPAATGSFTVQLLSGVATDSTTSPHPQIQVINTGTTPLALNNVTVRYWLNCDCTNQTIQAWLDWAGLMPSGQTATTNVHVAVESTSLGTQTNYILYSFTGNMVLQPGQAIQIQSRFNKSDWSNMTQSNDWSYQANTRYTNDSQITGYIASGLVWGQEPAAAAAPALRAASVIGFPNPSTGNGVNLSVNLSGTTTSAGASGVKAMADSTTTLSVDPSAQVTLAVFTLSGRQIWSTTLPAASFGSSGVHDYYWDERDLAGAPLSNGVYYVRVTVKSGGQSTSSINKLLILR